MTMHKWLASLLLGIALISNQAQSAEQTWKVNLKDADIRALIAQVSNITGYSFVIDPRVKGKVTIMSDADMNKETVYQMFLSVLNVNGFAAVPAGNVIKIIQQNDVKQEGGSPFGIGRNKGEDLVAAVIQIKDTPALDLVPILRPMVAKYGHLAGVKSANALIVIDSVANIKRIEKIIEKLDNSGSEDLEVVQLEKAWVGDVVEILKSLDPEKVSEGKTADTSGVQGRIRVVADERANRIIIKGEKSARDRIKSLIADLDSPSKFAGSATVIRLQYADAKKMAELLKNLLGDVADEKGNKTGAKASVNPDEGLNALVIRAEPSVLSEIREIVSQLDVRRAQVLIEAAIVEIIGNNAERIGTQLAAVDLDNINSGQTPLLGTNFGDAGQSLTDIITGIKTGAPSLASGMTIGGGGLYKGQEFAVVIQALQSVSNSNLLSTPSIMTLDNQEAEIVVGQNVPFVTGSTSSTSNSNPFTTIKRQDVGTTLKVIPHIHDGKFIRLEVEQSTESVQTKPVEGQADLITNKRSIKTQILAEDKEIIVLGGLINDAVEETQSKIPFLGDIPLIGWLFRSTSETKVKQNLMVFIKPSIVLNKEDSADIARRKFDGIYEVDLSDKLGVDGIDKQLNKLFKN
ncbi:MAG: type II secretion system secretin GspD [Oceanospirillaceae bacterium]|nr:type II secretion system secretin GspD [Oceanospirillaceae bacterium]MCP5350189.1 type II secretion system secretin GspD [Oceanospirillaceae bacterium]